MPLPGLVPGWRPLVAHHPNHPGAVSERLGGRDLGVPSYRRPCGKIGRELRIDQVFDTETEFGHFPHAPRGGEWATQIVDRVAIVPHPVDSHRFRARGPAQLRSYQDLSGGEQQRIQLASVIAQVWKPVRTDGPNWLFLDEAVSSLDIGQKLSAMRLARAYAQAGGGVVAVMHDMNLTAMFADHLVMMQEGRITGAGKSQDVLNSSTLFAVYGCSLRINTPPPAGVPYLLPQAAEAFVV